jgi:hypothetical protein
MEFGAVSIDSDGYEIYHPGVSAPLGSLPLAAGARASR